MGAGKSSANTGARISVENLAHHQQLGSLQIAGASARANPVGRTCHIRALRLLVG